MLNGPGRQLRRANHRGFVRGFHHRFPRDQLALFRIGGHLPGHRVFTDSLIGFSFPVSGLGDALRYLFALLLQLFSRLQVRQACTVCMTATDKRLIRTPPGEPHFDQRSQRRELKQS